MDFNQFLQGLPAPAWGLAGTIVGTVAGAYGTLRATKVTNSSNDRRFERQLEHDAAQNSKDRAAALRRDVYLTAAEQLAEISGFLGQLASFDPTDTKAISAGMLGFFKATAKVSLVASERTREKVTELSGAYGKLFIELLVDASNAHQTKININVNRDAYRAINAERTRIVSAMQDTNENAESKYKFEALSNSFNRMNARSEELTAEFLDLSDKHNDALAAYAASTADKLSGLSELQVEASALLRAEFDLDVDVETMKTQSREQSAKAREAGKAFFDKLRKIREGDS